MSNLLVTRRQLLQGLGIGGAAIIVPGGLSPKKLSQIIEPATAAHRVHVLGTALQMINFDYCQPIQTYFSVLEDKEYTIDGGPQHVQMTFQSIGQVTPELLAWCKEEMC